MKVLHQRNQWIETAKNLNQKPENERKIFVNHIKGKYRDRLLPSIIDRLDEYAAGYNCDYSLTGFLDKVGITL